MRQRENVECPKCGAVVKPPGGKPHCPSCGWNRERAKKHLKEQEDESRWGAPFLGLVGLAFVLLGFLLLDGIERVLVSTLGFLMGGLALWGRWHMHKLRAAFSPSDHPQVSGSPGQPPSTEATTIPEKYQFLLSLSRPRKVRRHWFKISWEDEEKRYRLLAKGEIAFGRVMAQETIPGSIIPGAGAVPSHNEITYEFRDPSGFLREGKVTDETRTFFEEMTIPVFYDPQNPRDNTVLTDLNVLSTTSFRCKQDAILPKSWRNALMVLAVLTALIALLAYTWPEPVQKVVGWIVVFLLVAFVPYLLAIVILGTLDWLEALLRRRRRKDANRC